MKKNRTLRVSALLLALTLITTCFVGGTFAKYTSSASVTGTANVAKWSFKVNSTDIATTNDFIFNLFADVKDSDGTSVEGDVINSKIAPGTSGSFALTLTNASEVTATYAINYTVNNAGVPLQFSVDNGRTWGDLANVSATTLAAGADTTITVQWRWAFDGDDNTDTALGIAATAQPSVNVEITATQID